MNDIKKDLVQWQIDMGHPGEDWMFTFANNHKENLVICLGDSWTWGDSLPDRENEMYGRLLSDYLNADLINVGCPGWSNSWVLKNGEVILSSLRKNNQYKKVYVIVTLTENARDIKTAKSFDFAKWVFDNRPKLTKDLYHLILETIEQHWSSQLQQLVDLSDDRFIFFVGQNFVWHTIYNKLSNIPRVIITDVNWIEVLADAQNLPRPIRTNIVTRFSFDTFHDANTQMSTTDLTYFKDYCLPLIAKAIEVNKWLDRSPMNYKKASKHPNAEGHKLWANHIFHQLVNFN
jgi:lysophospholipase L1-like esterase